MNYKPPYWYHSNIKFSSEELDKLKFEIDTIGSEKQSKDKKHVTTFFLSPNQKPEDKYKNIYSSIVEDITKNVGIYYKTKYLFSYWLQLYDKNMMHRAHHHADVDDNLDTIISWVHFIDVPKQKLFRFTDTTGNFFVPEEQNQGDIICFPSWVWHEVLPNNSNERRVVLAGNITVTHYDD